MLVDHTGELLTVTELTWPGSADSAALERVLARGGALFTGRGEIRVEYGRAEQQSIDVDPAAVVLLRPGGHFHVSQGRPGRYCGIAVSLTPAGRSMLPRESLALRNSPTRVMASPAVLLQYRLLRRRLWRSGHPEDGGAAADGRPLDREADWLALLRRATELALAGGPISEDARPVRSRRALAEETRRILTMEPAEDHRLVDLAQRLGVSPFHLAHVFRAEIGMPIHRYLLRLRLALSMEHLARGERNLSALALDLGFATHSHFTAAFRQVFGVTPSAVRQQLSVSGPVPRMLA